MPEMSYVSKGKLHFLTRHVDKHEWAKPHRALLTSTIHVGNVITLNLKKKRIEILYTPVLDEYICFINKNSPHLYFY